MFAIASTLLVRDLHRPEGGPAEAGLALVLARQWPSHGAFVTSIFTIGVLWLNHHATLAVLRLVDHAGQVPNLFPLLAAAPVHGLTMVAMAVTVVGLISLRAFPVGCLVPDVLYLRTGPDLRLRRTT